MTFQVKLRRLRCVLARMNLMRVCQVRVMRRLLMVARFVMIRCFRVMMRGHTRMVRGLAMCVHCLL